MRWQCVWDVYEFVVLFVAYLHGYIGGFSEVLFSFTTFVAITSMTFWGTPDAYLLNQIEYKFHHNYTNKLIDTLQ